MMPNLSPSAVLVSCAETNVNSYITTFKSIWTELQGQIYVVSEPFIQNMQKLIEVLKAQHRAGKKALKDFAKTYNKQEVAARAYLSGHHTMATIADYFNVHYATISRWVKEYEGKV